jgi:Tol biopolymer transport system component
MKKLDWVGSSVIIVTILLLSGVILIGNHVPVKITCQSPTPCTQVGPYGSIVFEFSRPVHSDNVEILWQTAPLIEGKWEWLDDQHARWTSTMPLPSNQMITFRFNPGQAGQNGEMASGLNQWEVKVRSPRIIGIRKDGSSEMQLTDTNDSVYDYHASPDGESVVFSVMNDLKGVDLWIVQRDGSGQHKLLDCGADRCYTPAWSPLMGELAYTRESAGLTPDGPNGAPRIWILDAISGKTSPLFADQQKIGYGPKWSPDGLWLSIWDGLHGGIQVVNRKTGESFMLESANGDAGSWTLGSQFLYYSNVVLGGASFRNVVLKADIGNRSISTLFGGNTEGSGFSIDDPVCSPKDNWVAVTIQPNMKIPGAKLYLLNTDTDDSKLIMDDLSRNPSFYSWDTNGDRLVFQLNLLSGKENDVEIWVWDWNLEAAKKITDGSRTPQWLP